MFEILLAFPMMIVACLIQVSVFGRIHLINGSADLLMLITVAWCLNNTSRYSWFWALLGGLMMTFVSALPWNGYIFVYLFLWFVIVFLKKRLWQMPLILMLFMTMIGTLTETVFSLGVLTLNGASINYLDAFQRITIPSLVMNLLLAVPVYALLRDIGYTLYPGDFDE